ncbi:serine/arginine repetitive matrix protein 1-like [Ixodes scapularis]
MEVSKLRIPELVAVCEELGISVGQAKRRKPIMELLREKEVSDVELQEAWELIRERDEKAKAEKQERDERAKAEKQERDERAKAEKRERDERANAEKQERDEKREREREERVRELAEKRLEIETLMQEVRSQRRTVVVEVTDSKYLAATFPHWFTYEGDPKPREKDLVSRRERAVALSGARTRQVAAETVGQKEKVEEEEFNLTDDQGLRADGTTDAVPHNADSRPEALEVGGDPAKGREEASQASDVCFLGDEDKASMVMPPRKSIQLEESNVEKSADGEAEQEVGRPSRPPWNSETKPGLDERDQSQGCSEKASCSSRPSGKKEQKRKQRRVSVFRPAPNDSDQQRQQRRDASSQKQKSSRPEREKRGGTHPNDPSAGGGCKRKGSKGSAERTRLDEENPEQGPSKTSSPSQNDIGCPSRRKRHRRKRQPEISVLRPGADISDEGQFWKSDEGESRRRELSSRLGHKNPADIHPKEVFTDNGCERKGLGCDKEELSVGKREDPKRRRSERSSRLWHGKSECDNSGADISGPFTQKRHKKRRLRRVGAFQSGPAPSNQQRHQKLKRSNSRKRKPSSGLGDGNREDIHPKKAPTDSGWRSKEHSGDARKPKLKKQEGSKQRRFKRLSARNSRKFSSRQEESKRQNTYHKEPLIQTRSASNGPRGDTSKSTLDAEMTRQSRSDEKNEGCEESRSVRKPRVKPSHLSHASTTRRDDQQNAGTLLDKSSISSKYLGSYECVLASQLVLQREIKSDAEIKSELSDCGFEETFESGTRAFLVRVAPKTDWV